MVDWNNNQDKKKESLSVEFLVPFLISHPSKQSTAWYCWNLKVMMATMYISYFLLDISS